MELQRFGDINIGQGVAGHDDKRVVFQILFGLFDRPCRAKRRVLNGINEVDAHVRAVAEVLLDFFGQGSTA